MATFTGAVRRLDEAKAVLTRALEAAERSGTLIGQVNACDCLGEVSLGLGDLDDARRFYLRAYELSVEHGYRRGEAWALFGLGRCGYALDLPHEAHQLFAGALEAHQELGDLPSSATALDGMARAAAAMGDAAAETHARVDAVLAIEAMRSSQDRHQYQQEYRERFAAVYSAAIRAAVRNADPAAFITVFENLAGRRLAGLLEKIPAVPAVENAQIASHVLATASNLPTDGGDLAATMASAERRARLIGRLALRGGMPETAERAIADIAAALYRSFSPGDAGPLLSRAATHADVLLATLVPGADHQIAWLRAGPGRPTRTGVREIAGTVQQLVTSLARDGLPPLARPDAVSELAHLLPADAFEGMADDAPLLIVPLGRLWALPWPAVSVGGRFLGERFTLAVAPSLTLADHVRESGARPEPRTIGQWRSPQIRYHELVAFTDDTRVTVESFGHVGEDAVDVVAGRVHAAGQGDVPHDHVQADRPVGVGGNADAADRAAVADCAEQRGQGLHAADAFQHRVDPVAAGQAGVSVPYYTRLERGDARGATDAVLDAIARALLLDDAERAHLFDLVRAANATAAARATRRTLAVKWQDLGG